MAKVNLDFIEPNQAVMLARRELAQFDVNDSSSLAGWFPSQEVDDIEYEIGVGEKAGFITAANWRMFNGNTTSEVWGQGEKSRGRFMPLSRNYTMDEEGALRMRNNPEALMQREAGNLIRRGAKAIAITINRERARIMQDGEFILRGPGGLKQKVSFGRDPRLSTSAAELWTTDTADILGQIEDYAALYEEINGFKPAKVMIPAEIRRQMTTQKQMIGAATRDPNAKRASAQELRELFAEYDLPEIIDTPNSKIQVDNLDTGKTEIVDLFDRDSILFVPDSGNPRDPEAAVYGRTFWGRTKTADMPEFRGTAADTPGVVAGVLHHDWPYNEEVIIDALAMPVAFNANYTMKVTVK